MHFIQKKSLHLNCCHYYSVNPDSDTTVTQYITKNLGGSGWLNDEFIGSSYTKVHIWLLLQSILLDQLWCMWAAFWRRRWMMTWGNGLEECGEIASWKMPICAWRSFSASPRVSVSGWALNKSRAGTLALHIWLCYAFSFMTADWVTVML